jgi:hypothetical protein
MGDQPEATEMKCLYFTPERTVECHHPARLKDRPYPVANECCRDLCPGRVDYQEVWELVAQIATLDARLHALEAEAEHNETLKMERAEHE